MIHDLVLSRSADTENYILDVRIVATTEENWLLLHAFDTLAEFDDVSKISITVEDRPDE
jgi:hypothetical protein